MHRFHGLAARQLPLVRMESLTRCPTGPLQPALAEQRARSGQPCPFCHSIHILIPEASSGSSSYKGEGLLPALRPQNVAEVSAWEPRIHPAAPAWLQMHLHLPQPLPEVTAAGAVGLTSTQSSAIRGPGPSLPCLQKGLSPWPPGRDTVVVYL